MSLNVFRSVINYMTECLLLSYNTDYKLCKGSFFFILQNMFGYEVVFK